MAGATRLEVGLRAGPVEVHFTAQAGVVGLFGPSGSGKTTIVEAIAGIRRPRAGRIILGGHVLFDASAGIHLPPRRRRVGLVPQEGLLFPHLDVRRNIEFASSRGPLELSRLAALLEVESLLDRSPHTLSGGERQRVALGRALAAGPELLLLDEPLSALDDALRERLLTVLGRVKELGIAMVLVSHRARELRALADEVVVLSLGRVVRQGPPEVALAPPLEELSEEPISLLRGVVAARLDEVARVAIDGSGLELEVVSDAPVGHAVRLEVPSSAVALEVRGDAGAGSRSATSARNHLHVRVEALQALGDRVLVVLGMWGDPGRGEPAGAIRVRLHATLTRRSALELGLVPGLEATAVLKATAIRSAIK